MIRNRRKLISIFLILMFVFSGVNVYASDFNMESIDINVYVNEDGSARITENRVMSAYAGTEIYVLMNNLGKSQIKDFVVSENGEIFEFVNKWNINASREEKSGKNGIIKTSSGYELAWGLGEYGDHNYTLEYTITDFVKQLEDAQVILWEFLTYNTNIPPEQVRVVIESPYDFIPEEEAIWGFGFDGYIEFLDGKIVATSNQPLTSQNYVTILAKLPQEMFGTKDVLNKNFEQIKDTAFVGSDYSNEDYENSGTANDASSSGSSTSPFSFMPFIGFFAAFFGLISSLIFAVNSKLINAKPVKFKRKYKEEYYRDYPYEGDFLDIYYIPYLMGISTFENLLTGFILKWINENRVITVEEEQGWIFKKDKTNIKFLNKNFSPSTLEGELFQMMLTAAGKNEILEESEFTKWAQSNVTKLNDWEKRAKQSSIDKLEAMGYIEIFKKKVFLFKTEKYELTEKGKELETRIYKYINYLNDFSLLNEHEAVNVMIWDNIMIWAGFLGLTEVVSKQFQKLYPRYSQGTVYTGNTIVMTDLLARNISQAKVATTRSSGGGGGTSFGGGGGSFGGGGGGGVR